MKNKLFSFILILMVVFVPSFTASETTKTSDELPSWIDVKYSDLIGKEVSEYQMVTITAKVRGLWYLDNTNEVDVVYDPNQLELVNTAITNSKMDSELASGESVSLEESNFDVSYQFLLKPEANIETANVMVSKVKNDDVSTTKEAVVDLDTHNYSQYENYTFGDTTVAYAVDGYNNDTETITYDAKFKIVANPSDKDITLTFKQNNMTVDSSEDYDIQFTSEDGKVIPIDDLNYQLKGNEGDEFNLRITASISGLSSKNDKFSFFIMVSNGDNFVRISPMFFRSELITASTNLRIEKYMYIKLMIAMFFIALTILFILVNRRRARKIK